MDLQFKVGSEPPGDAEKHIEKSIGVWRDLNPGRLAGSMHHFTPFAYNNIKNNLSPTANIFVRIFLRLLNYYWI